MKITLLDIKGFGLFNQKKIVPDNSFNIIYGSNESGKSTLLAFIKAMLYGLKGGKRTRDTDKIPARRYKPWKGDFFAGVMEYSLDSGESFRVGRNFDKGTVNIHDSSSNNITSLFPLDRDQGPRFADEHLGINEALSEKSIFIGQMQSAVDEDGRRLIIEKLSNLSSSGNEDVSLTKALSALEAANLEKVGTGRTSTRPLDQTVDRINELKAQKAYVQEQIELYLNDWAQLKQEMEEYSTISSRIEGLKAQKASEQANRLIRLSEQYYEAQNQIHEANHEIERLKDRLTDLSRFAGILDTDLDEISTLYFELCETERILSGLGSEEYSLEVRLEELSKKSDELKSVKDRLDYVEEHLTAMNDPFKKHEDSKSRIPQVLPVALLVMAAISLFIGLWIVPYFRLPAAVISAIFLISGIVLFFLGRRGQEYMETEMNALTKGGFESFEDYIKQKEYILDMLHEMESIKKEKESLNDKRKLKLVRRNEIMEVLGIKLKKPEALKDLPAFDNEVNSFKANINEYRESSIRISMLEEKISAINEKMRLYLREASGLTGKNIITAAGLEKYIEEIQYTCDSYDPEESEKLEEELRIAGQAAKEKEIRIKTLEAKLQDAPHEGALSGIEEELSRLNAKKDMLEELSLSIAAAVDGLKTAAADIKKDFVPALNTEMGRMMTLMTQGRYSEVKTDDNFRIVLETPETEELISAARLSGGTIDQVYLSMRLSAIKLIESGKETLPLFMDEPFSQYDEERALKAFELLKSFSESRQIFFLTCREREIELAGKAFGDKLNVIKL